MEKPTFRSLVNEALTKAGSKGLSAPEIYRYAANAGVVPVKKESALCTIAKRGYVFRVGTRHDARYYATALDRAMGKDEWEARVLERRSGLKRERRKHEAALKREARAAASAMRKAEPRKRTTATHGVHAPWSVDEPGIITPATRITVAPRPPDPIRTNTYWR